MSSSRSQPSGNSYTSAANVEGYRFSLFVVLQLVAFRCCRCKYRAGQWSSKCFDRVGDCIWASFTNVHVSLIRITCCGSTHLTSTYFQPAEFPNPAARSGITFKDMDSTLG